MKAEDPTARAMAEEALRQTELLVEIMAEIRAVRADQAAAETRVNRRIDALEAHVRSELRENAERFARLDAFADNFNNLVQQGHGVKWAAAFFLSLFLGLLGFFAARLWPAP